MDPVPNPERTAYSVAVFARNAGAVLMIKHARLGIWLPPGGEVDNDPFPARAAARELIEETGLVASYVPWTSSIEGVPKGLLGYEEHECGSKGVHKNFVFVVDVDTREVHSDGSWTEHVWATWHELWHLDLRPNVLSYARLALDPRQWRVHATVINDNRKETFGPFCTAMKAGEFASCMLAPHVFRDVTIIAEDPTC